VVNMSLALSKEPVTANDWNKKRINQTAAWLAEQDTIVVTGAGNTGRPMLSDKQDFPGLVVGGVLSSGRIWPYSSTGEAISIFAPSANLYLDDPMGNLTVREGTSFASPIVAGSVINTLEILPELKLSHLKMLLQRSAIYIQQSNGTFIKMINAYKMVKVAKRIKDMLNSVRLSSNLNKNQFIMDQLNNPEIYSFSKEAKEEFRIAKAMGLSRSCDGAKTLKHLRASFLLDQSGTAKTELATIYKYMGYSQDALFYSSKFGKPNW
jgi:hypothetical protein